MKNPLLLGINTFVAIVLVQCNNVIQSPVGSTCKIKKYYFECTSDSICKYLTKKCHTFIRWDSDFDVITISDTAIGRFVLKLSARDSMTDIHPFSFRHPMTAFLTKIATYHKDTEPRDFEITELISNQKYMITLNKDTNFIFMNGFNEIDVSILDKGNAVELFKNHVINIRHVK